MPGVEQEGEEGPQAAAKAHTELREWVIIGLSQLFDDKLVEEKDMWTTQGDEDEEYLLSELLEQMVPGDDDELRKLKKRVKAIEAVLIELRDDDKLVKYQAGSIHKVNPAVFSDGDEDKDEDEDEDEGEEDVWDVAYGPL